MSKNRNQDALLADFAVHLYGYQPLKIRASSQIVIDQWLYLRDAGGGILFSAPQMNIHYVKRLEPGEVPLAPERVPEPTAVFAPENDPGPIEVASAFASAVPVLLDDPRCTAPNATGRRCKLDAVPGTDKCTVHA